MQGEGEMEYADYRAECEAEAESEAQAAHDEQAAQAEHDAQMSAEAENEVKYFKIRGVICMSEANYKIEALPTNNKKWDEANDIEISLNLELEKETKTFKGIISLSGIVKK